MTVLESVPNVSEGRNAAVIARIAAAFGATARLLDVHSDADHHRSVFTLVAEPQQIVEALLQGIARSIEAIDLRSHDGIHPRVGAVDVVPVVPMSESDLPRALETAREIGERVAREHAVPVFLYGESGGGLRPAFFRRGGPGALQGRIDEGELTPDFGPAVLHPTAGAMLVGARRLLVAFNLELVGADLEDARAVAAAIRASNGGLPGVQALGLRLPRSGRIQVSLNLVDTEQARLADVVALVREEALRRGIETGAGELVGLLPERQAAPPEALGLAALPDTSILERAIAAGGRHER